MALLDYAFGLALARLPGNGTRERRAVVTAAVAVNLATLIVFKYAGFFGDNLNFIFGNAIGRQVQLSQIYLPLGISFFTSTRSRTSWTSTGARPKRGATRSRSCCTSCSPRS